MIDLFEACGRWRPCSPLAPVLALKNKRVAMSPSSTVHGGQYDAKDVTFE